MLSSNVNTPCANTATKSSSGGPIVRICCSPGERPAVFAPISRRARRATSKGVRGERAHTRGRAIVSIPSVSPSGKGRSGRGRGWLLEWNWRGYTRQSDRRAAARVQFTRGWARQICLFRLTFFLFFFLFLSLFTPFIGVVFPFPRQKGNATH